MPTAATPARAFDGLLLDFGGVFTTSPFTALRDRGEINGHGAEAMLTLVMGSYDEDTDHPWHRLERGELALADAIELIMAEATRLGVEFEPGNLRAYFGPASVHDVVVQRVRALRSEGYRIALVTNNVRELRRLWEPLIPVLELFDVIVDSSEVGVRKPDPRIFEIALARLGVTAERAVFVDDWPGNVAAARALGMAGVVMGDDPVVGLADLDRVLAGNG